jgi:pyruvate-ferredoxin/flavodoxin oxidoreductase
MPRQPSQHTAARRTKPGLICKFTIQVAAEDCTGCAASVWMCAPPRTRPNPGKKAINMEPQLPIRRAGTGQLGLLPVFAQPRSRQLNLHKISHQQMQEPLFEFSGACAGCGETPYIKLATQLFGDRMLIANATGCSSIYGGNLPTTPYTHNDEGRGPAWSNSLFEDNAEFGWASGCRWISSGPGAGAAASPLPLIWNGLPLPRPGHPDPDNQQTDEADIFEQRQGVQLKGQWQSWLADLAEGMQGTDTAVARSLQNLHSLADYLVQKERVDRRR